MQVFKFGGASVKDADGVRNVAKILQKYKGQKLAVVVSAMGKMTNALEAVVEAHARQTGQAARLFDEIKAQHLALMAQLFEPGDAAFDHVNDLFVEVEWVLEEAPDPNFDRMYDQVVSVGELVSTRIVAAFLEKSGLPTTWLDARDLIFTDETWREGRVNWEKTRENCLRLLSPALSKGFALTQGFIGSTVENRTTTLGREGSDYSAAILSHCLDAERMAIWKDVPGVLTGDPRLFENVSKLDRLSYREAIEMTYYGASVIHPKTIKPLQNKGIPLFVKSFIEPEASGTEISGDVEGVYPPMVMVEKNQALLHIAVRDYSFVAEHHLSHLFGALARHRLIVNSMQNTAISFTVVVPDIRERIEKLTEEIGRDFKTAIESGLELITVRHPNEEIIQSMRRGKIVLFEERLRNTIQMVVKNVPLMERREVDIPSRK